MFCCFHVLLLSLYHYMHTGWQTAGNAQDSSMVNKHCKSLLVFLPYTPWHWTYYVYKVFRPYGKWNHVYFGPKFLNTLGRWSIIKFFQSKCKVGWYLEIAFPDKWPLRQVSLYNITLNAYSFRRCGLDCYIMLLMSMNGLEVNVVISLWQRHQLMVAAMHFLTLPGKRQLSRNHYR